MSQPIVVNIMSFGFKKGVPEEAEMIYDVRFAQNPYYVDELRPLTGNDKAVSDYVLADQMVQKFVDQLMETLMMILPRMEGQDRESLNLCLGCTGGHHRSVAVANEVNRRLIECGVKTTLKHRQLDR